jgi:SAM-dependent methyltransferase
VAKRLSAFGRHWPLRGERLLDVGCGNGAYTMVMAEGFREVEAIDVEPGRLEELSTALRGSPLQARIQVREMSAQRLAFPDQHFDVVTAIEVIEHIADLEAALDEIRRVLRPGGVLCVACPNRLFPIETHTFTVPFSGRELPGRFLPFLPYLPPIHRRLATARNFMAGELRELMLDHGLEERAVDYIMPPFDGWALGRRLLKPITEQLERSPLRIFGVSIIGIYQRPAAPRSVS